MLDGLTEELFQRSIKYAEDRYNYEIDYFISLFANLKITVDDKEKIMNWIKEHLIMSCKKAYQQGIKDYKNCKDLM